MHQFEIKTYFPLQLGSIDASFTNSSLFMVIAAALLTILMLAGMSRRAMVPGRLQSIVELSYEFIANMLRDNVGTAGLRFFPFVFTLFMFILALNLLGMIPYSFTVTSHIIVTFALAFFIFIGVTILGFAVHGFGFFKFFVPHGVPAYLLPLVVPIEVVSYLTRPISLSVRLFANMMAGHTVLKVFAGFVIALGAFGYLPGLLPLAFMVALTGLEVLVAALQAYVFAILTCIYLNDALHMH
ncbi:F0F1 ATP synthase subunit A [Parvibaculum sp.]|uniref:F0F1 ATP synthase subunit A n=2 Tax=Parvibaculum sp. TaxID=2024848 RepID=UPI001B2BF55E|nr:F0F1 ATP synthase subunit A [Parvibaculum sp.]MBO6634278.1 F0F1 ATP synthase subunit A [Parvibaculum sp.]MBO6678419.1 F0F1 ATP synthase subunit A [Parvibaculum sp.]MBO6905026.1 F0F1 ATP synthase subunit A [Parvibaculum sp.]